MGPRGLTPELIAYCLLALVVLGFLSLIWKRRRASRQPSSLLKRLLGRRSDFSGPKEGLFVVVVDGNLCLLSSVFLLPSPTPRELVQRLAGNLIQIVGLDGFAASPAILVPKGFIDDPNANIFQVIHDAYEKQKGQMIHDEPGHNEKPPPDPEHPPQPDGEASPIEMDKTVIDDAPYVDGDLKRADPNVKRLLEEGRDLPDPSQFPTGPDGAPNPDGLPTELPEKEQPDGQHGEAEGNSVPSGHGGEEENGPEGDGEGGFEGGLDQVGRPIDFFAASRALAATKCIRVPRRK